MTQKIDFQPLDKPEIKALLLPAFKGGVGSGFHGHVGRPGKRGGSARGGYHESKTAKLVPSKARYLLMPDGVLIYTDNKYGQFHTLLACDYITTHPKDFSEHDFQRAKAVAQRSIFEDDSTERAMMGKTGAIKLTINGTSLEVVGYPGELSILLDEDEPKKLTANLRAIQRLAKQDRLPSGLTSVQFIGNHDTGLIQYSELEDISRFTGKPYALVAQYKDFEKNAKKILKLC